MQFLVRGAAGQRSLGRGERVCRLALGQEHLDHPELRPEVTGRVAQRLFEVAAGPDHVVPVGQVVRAE